MSGGSDSIHRREHEVLHAQEEEEVKDRDSRGASSRRSFSPAPRVPTSTNPNKDIFFHHLHEDGAKRDRRIAMAQQEAERTKAEEISKKQVGSARRAKEFKGKGFSKSDNDAFL